MEAEQNVFQAVNDDLQDIPLQGNGSAAGGAAAAAVFEGTDEPATPKTPASAAVTQYPAPLRQRQLSVQVHSPESESDTGYLPTSHTVYTVETSSELTSFPRAHASVKRRHSDFTELHDALANKYAGYFVPPCPKKTWQSKLAVDSRVLEGRAKDLELFVNRCAQHRELQPCQVRQHPPIMACNRVPRCCGHRRIPPVYRLVPAQTLLQQLSPTIAFLSSKWSQSHRLRAREPCAKLAGVNLTTMFMSALWLCSCWPCF